MTFAVETGNDMAAVYHTRTVSTLSLLCRPCENLSETTIAIFHDDVLLRNNPYYFWNMELASSDLVTDVAWRQSESRKPHRDASPEVSFCHLAAAKPKAMKSNKATVKSETCRGVNR